MYQRECKANLKVCDNENVMWSLSILDHNHNSDEENKLKRHIIRNCLKRKTAESMCSPFQIVAGEIQRIDYSSRCEIH